MSKIPPTKGQVRIESDGIGLHTRIRVMVKGEPVDISHAVVAVKWEMSAATKRRGQITLELMQGEVDIQGKLRELIVQDKEGGE